MEYQDGSKVQYGDIVYILRGDGKYVTVEENETTVSFQDHTNNGQKQKILVCGNDKLADQFYLTFKYGKGFLKYDNTVLGSGVPWTERSLFSLDLLKQAIGDTAIQVIKTSEENWINKQNHW